MSRTMTSADRRNARRSEQRQHQQALRRQRNIRSPRVVPWSDLREGVVIDAALEYRDDRRQWKRRPAIVVGITDRGVEIYECTTALRRHPEQVALHDWALAGLADPTAVWIRRRSIDRSHILGIVGVLTDGDASRLHRISAVMQVTSARVSRQW